MEYEVVVILRRIEKIDQTELEIVNIAEYIVAHSPNKPFVNVMFAAMKEMGKTILNTVQAVVNL